MTTSLPGRITNVVIFTAGGDIEVPTLATDTVLQLSNAMDFEGDGGMLSIDGAAPVAYVDRDPDAGIVTLLAAVGSVVTEGTRVAPSPTWPEKQALVSVTGNDDDGVWAVVPHALDDKIPEGFREDIDQESVEIALINNRYQITNIYGKQPVIQASLLDQQSFPAKSDGNKPTSSPDIQVKGGIGSLALSWLSTTNIDTVTTNIYASDAPGVSTTGTPIASVVGNGPGVLFLRTINGQSVDPTKTYYFKSVQFDADGAALPSNETSGSPAQVNSTDIAAFAITAALLLANDAFIDALQASDLTSVTMTGALIQTDARPQMGVKLGQVGDQFNGLIAYGPSGDVFLSVDPARGIAIVAGEVKATTLTVFNGAALGGVTEISSGGRVLLTGGTTAPKGAPTVTSGYDQTQMFNDGNWTKRYGVTLDAAAGILYSIRVETTAVYAERWSMATGKIVTSVKQTLIGNGLPTDGLVTACLTPNSYSYLYHNVPNNIWLMVHLNKTTLAWVNDNQWSDGWTDTRAPGIAWDSAVNQWVVAQSNPYATPNDALYITHYLPVQAAKQGDTPIVPPQSGVLNTDVAYPNSLVALLYGQFDLSGNRYFYSTKGSGGVRVSSINTSAGTAPDQITEYWPSGVTTKRGLWWNANKSAFETIDETGLITTYTSNDKTTTYNDASITKWVSNTLATGSAPTYETTQSPRYKLILPKRSKMIVTTSAISNLGGATDPDRVVVYVGSGAADPGRAAMVRQVIAAPGTTTSTFTSLVTLPVVAPPAVSNYPNSAGSDFVATSGGFWVKDDSTGDVGTSGFRDSVVKAAQNTPPFCYLSNTAAQSPANGWSTATGWTETSDDQDMHSSTTAPDTILVTKAGWYRVEAGLVFSPNGTGRRVIDICYYNAANAAPAAGSATRLIRHEPAAVTATGYPAMFASKRVYIPANSRVRLDIYQNSGAALALRPGDMETYLQVMRERD